MIGFDLIRATEKLKLLLICRAGGSRNEVRRLQNLVQQLRAKHRAELLKWRCESTRLRRKLHRLQCEVKTLRLVQNEGILNQRQLKRLATGRQARWDVETVGKAVALRCISRKGYEFVRNIMKMPLPSSSTLSRWTRNFKIGSGIIDAALWVLKSAVEAMGQLERICCLCFDEMPLNNRPTYDQSDDVILDGSKLQLMLVRGLCSAWKQPIFYEVDSPVTIEKLNKIVSVLEDLGLDVRAVTSDMGPSNERLWRDAGINREKTWIPNPTDANK